MELFDNSFWRSGYPIGIFLVMVYFIISRINKDKEW